MKAIRTESLSPMETLNIQHIMKKGYLTALVGWARNDVLAFKDGGSSCQLTMDGNLSYILECLGPLLLNQKPAELLNIGLNRGVAWEEFKTLLTQLPEVGLFEVRKLSKRRQVLFYNRKILGQRLVNPISQEFFRRLNYPQSDSVEEHLEHLIQKIRFQDFPHEIGLILGYPLKDVLGFMGLAPLSYVKTRGWQVYGDERLSDEWFEKYQAARQLMSKALSDR